MYVNLLKLRNMWTRKLSSTHKGHTEMLGHTYTSTSQLKAWDSENDEDKQLHVICYPCVHKGEKHSFSEV